MKKEYIAFYEGDLLDYCSNNEEMDAYKFESKIIDGEMWFVMLADEEIKYPASIVFADDDWIVIDKNVLTTGQDKNMWVFKYDPKTTDCVTLQHCNDLFINYFPSQKFIFLPREIEVDEMEVEEVKKLLERKLKEAYEQSERIKSSRT